MTTKASYLILGSYQSFSVDKSLIKKLYSWKDRKKKRNG
jgi:hypothetical protein